VELFHVHFIHNLFSHPFTTYNLLDCLPFLKKTESVSHIIPHAFSKKINIQCTESNPRNP
jgi:hypothetical protein